ncbi:MAG: cytochrome C [Planctomycetes bacterium]|nr:cytochrome C [Planctomycetota bacterium]
MRSRVRNTLSIVATISLLAVVVRWYRGLDAGNLSDSSPISTVTKSLYVAERVCAECHSDQANDYRASGHANTFQLTAESDVARWLAGQTFNDPERPYAYEYHFDEASGLSVSIPKQFGDDHFQLPYLLGSGQNAITFLSLNPDRLGDTIGIEHRVSLYSNKDDPNQHSWDLDLTPGHRAHRPTQEVEHFGKLLRGDKLTSCVGCHTTQGKIVRQQIENLSPHVGCQNCHGPAGEHVTAMKNDTEDAYTGLTQQSAREEVEMCGRCHRLAHSESSADVSPNDIRIVRFQSVGLLQSRCFSESEGRLRCTTCHDPHQAVSRDAAHYVERCLSCHGEPNPTRCPVSPKTNCIQCHMPAIDIHRGIKFHDHWIRVRADRSDATQAGDE